MKITRQEIERAAAMLQGILVHTPLVRCPYLSHLIEGDVFLKLENLQVTGSFKPRGAYIKLKQLTPEQQARGVITMSAGNHAQGVAYHAARLEVPATIVMPENTPLAKIERTRKSGATLILQGESLADSENYALSLATQKKLTIIHPYNDLAVICGQATVGLEIFQDNSQLTTLIIPVGGGGLAAGIALAAEIYAPGIQLIGVQARHCTAMTRKLFPEKIPADASLPQQTLAEGIDVKVPGQLPTAILKTRLHDMIIVDESTIEQAIDSFILQQKIIIEGAGAVGVAALLQNPQRFRGQKVGIVISGGNIDARILSAILMRGLVNRQQLIRLSVAIADIPGTLSHVTGIIGACRGNIIEVRHQRWFNSKDVKVSGVEMVVEILDESHAKEIITTLMKAGYETSPHAT
jgi:threonine dehydratase